MSFVAVRSFITSFEKRFQEIERRVENHHRVGFIPKDGVKFDEDKKRWFVKFQDIKDEDATDGRKPFVSDWVAWETQSSGWLKVSSPPKEGQSIQMRSPQGVPERGSCAPYHNNEDNPSPSDKPDEFHMRVEKPGQDGKSGNDPDKILNIGYTQDGSTVQIGKTTHGLTKDTQNVTTSNNNVTTDNDTKKVSDTHSLTTNKRVVSAKDTTISSAKYALGGKVLINC